MPIRDRNGVFPPGGWSFFQPEFNWNAPAGLRFKECVDAIIKIRMANPRFNLSTDWHTVADTLETFTCHRINFDPHYCFQATEAQKKTGHPDNDPPLSPAKPEAAVPVGVIRSYTQGAHILTEWLGEGATPVSQDLAESRAKTCIACPFNVRGNWKTKVGKEVAKAVLVHLRSKNELALKVSGEKKLGTCNACLCHLPLKVWTPLNHILKNTSQETMDQFHPDCWVLNETKKKPLVQGWSRPEVTVVITNYQRPGFLTAAFQSVLAAGVRHIVVTSSGATTEIEAIHRKFKTAHPNTVIVSERGDSGCNANWLAGVKAAPTSWVTILHDDDLLLPEFRMLEKEIPTGVGFILWDPRRHGLSYKDKIPILDLPTGIYQAKKLFRNLMIKDSFTLSPTIGCFQKQDLIEILEEAQTNFKAEYHLTPTMMVGNDLLIWLRSIQRHRFFKYLKASLTSFGHHNGSTTCDEVFQKRGRLGPIYNRTRDYFTDSHPRIVHAVSRYSPADRETNRRIERAVLSWKSLYLSAMVEPVHVWKGLRDSSHVGDSRGTHYLKDILAAGMEKARAQDLIMFTNDDSVLHPDLPWFLFDFMLAEDSCCAFRKSYLPGRDPDLTVHHDFPALEPGGDWGRDMFCFSKSWLEKHWDLIPDYLLGSTDFDSTLATIIRMTKGVDVTPENWILPHPRCEIPNCFIYHEEHGATWSTAHNRRLMAGNLYNRRLTQDFINKHGVGCFIELGKTGQVEVISCRSNQVVPIITYLDVKDGMGAFAVDTIESLLKLGIRVEVYPASLRYDDKLLSNQLRSLIKYNTANPHPWRLVIYPCVHKPDTLDKGHLSKKTAWFSMWETTSIKDVDDLNRCGVVIVPCAWNLSVFSSSGVTAPIRICPLGVDGAVFALAENNVSGPLVFGSAAKVSAGGIRKGLQLVVQAFQSAFPTESDVKLKIKCFPEDPAIETKGDNRIEVAQQIFQQSQLVEWYRSINVFVSGSASEGWGRHQHAAMAMGRPIISVNIGGVSEFMSWENGYCVDYSIVAAEGIYQDMGGYFKPNLYSMAVQMRRAYEDRAELKEKSYLAARSARRFTLEHSAKTLVSILKEFKFL